MNKYLRFGALAVPLPVLHNQVLKVRAGGADADAGRRPSWT